MNKINFLRKILDNSGPDILELLMMSDTLDFFYETFLVINSVYNIEPLDISVKENNIEKFAIKVLDEDLDDILKEIKSINKEIILSHQKSAKLSYSKSSSKKIIYVKVNDIKKELLY